MSTEKMREKFEAWAATKPWTVDMLYRDGYVGWEAQFAFDAWQASRAAIEVELSYVCEEEFDDYSITVGYNLAIDSCANSVESLGLKVKP